MKLKIKTQSEGKQALWLTPEGHIRVKEMANKLGYMSLVEFADRLSHSKVKDMKHLKR